MYREGCRLNSYILKILRRLFYYVGLLFKMFFNKLSLVGDKNNYRIFINAENYCIKKFWNSENDEMKI